MSEIKDDSHNYCVYVHVNKINQKKYVGITSKPPEERWQNGNGYKKQIFYNAIKKYGWNNFEHIILEKNLTAEQASKKEKEYILLYDSFKNGYNNNTGGIANYRKSIKESLGEDKYNEYIKLLSNKRKEYLNNIRKKVICVNNGRIYNNLTEVSKEYNIDIGALTFVCRKETCSHKIDPLTGRYYIFLYYYENRDYDINKIVLELADNLVICLDDKKVYFNCSEAARVYKIHKNSILQCAKGKINVTKDNRHFLYYNDYSKKSLEELNELRKNTSRIHKVVLVNTNEIFNSCAEASRKYNISETRIGDCILGACNFAGFYNNIPLVWQDYDAFVKEPKKIIETQRNRLIHCITLDLYFSTLDKAAEYVNLNRNGIWRCCNNKQKTCGKDGNNNRLSWEYYVPSFEDKISLVN